MPIQYKDSIIDSTKWCREKASIFDVSHMCGLSLKARARFLLHSWGFFSIASLPAGWSFYACRGSTGSGANLAPPISPPSPLLQGKDAIPFIEKLVVGDIAGLKVCLID